MMRQRLLLIGLVGLVVLFIVTVVMGAGGGSGVTVGQMQDFLAPFQRFAINASGASIPASAIEDDDDCPIVQGRAGADEEVITYFEIQPEEDCSVDIERDEDASTGLLALELIQGSSVDIEWDGGGIFSFERTLGGGEQFTVTLVAQAEEDASLDLECVDERVACRVRIN
jgi:hypothetical protein